MQKIYHKIAESNFILDKSSDLGSLDSPHSLYEGDNLEVLKNLQNQYKNKISLAFFDPPYNSNKDFILNDNKGRGPPFWNSGVSHETWLQMIYLRLLLVKNILKDDGIFVGMIDDKEFPYFKLILDEIFGEDNFVGNIIWKSMSGIKSNALFSINHTYILIYSKEKKKNKKVPFESIWTDLDTSIQSRENLENIIGNIISPNYIRFLNPKPNNLLERILSFVSTHDYPIILDLFAGTASMGESLINLNFKDNGNRIYLGIQIPITLKAYINKKELADTEIGMVTIFQLAIYRLQCLISQYMKNNPIHDKDQGIKIYRKID